MSYARSPKAEAAAGRGSPRQKTTDEGGRSEQSGIWTLEKEDKMERRVAYPMKLKKCMDKHKRQTQGDAYT